MYKNAYIEQLIDEAFALGYKTACGDIATESIPPQIFEKFAEETIGLTKTAISERSLYEAALKRFPKGSEMHEGIKDSLKLIRVRGRSALESIKRKSEADIIPFLSGLQLGKRPGRKATSFAGLPY